MSDIITRAALLKKQALSKEPRVLRAIVVENHSLLLKALERVVSAFSGVEVVTSFETFEEVYKNIKHIEADVVILGISVPVHDCLKFTEFIREAQLTRLELVIIRLKLFPETVKTFVKQGIHGLLDEYASERDLADAISTVAMGSIFLNRHAREVLATSLSRAAVYLTVREMEVVNLLKKGVSNSHIAQTLCLKEKTVEAYLTRIYSKLGVSSRGEAIVSLANLDI